jgi:flagellar hook-length control protein FliK
MEASLLAVTPTPKPPQDTSVPTTQTTDDASPFTDFLSTAITATKAPQKEKKELDPEAASASDPSQQEMSMAAALAALSFQDIPVLTTDQPALEQDMATTLTLGNLKQLQTILTVNGQNATGLKPGDLKHLQAMLAANGQNATGLTTDDLKQFQAMLAANGQNATGLTTDDLKQFQAMLAANGQNATGLTTDDLKQFQAMLAANGQNVTGLKPEATKNQTTSTLNKTETLVNQQLQAILNGKSKDTLSIDTSHQSASTESLNTLSSPYLKSVDNTSNGSLPPVHMAMLEGTGAGVKETDTGKAVRQTVTEQFLHTKFDGLVDKNNTKNQQQDNGRQENSQNQQNAATATLTSSLNTNEQTGQFNLAALGVPVSAATTVNTPVTHPAALSSSVPVPAEELISHLVDRFSTNPRLQTSKISLNLNPAELGALKIEIQVKGDSIKAHIVAGSQQIQDTIEKNMPRLRSILEQQGFTIEDFQVTLESTNPDANNFFQQQFSSRQDSGPHTTPAGSEDSFDLSLNSAEAMLNAPKDSGVNLSI